MASRATPDRFRADARSAYRRGAGAGADPLDEGDGAEGREDGAGALDRGAGALGRYAGAEPVPGARTPAPAGGRVTGGAGR